MAAVTEDRIRRIVIGNRRLITGQIDIAADADTLATGLKKVEFVSCTSTTNNGIGATISGGTVTFQTAGAEADAVVHIIGF